MTQAEKRKSTAGRSIAIVGSKPDSVMPDCDIIYFVNGSIILFQDQLGNGKEIFNVINGNSIRNYDRIERYQASGAPVGTLISNMHKFKYSRFVLYNTEENDSVNILLDLGIQPKNIRVITRGERDTILKKITGYNMPLGTLNALRELSLYEFARLTYAGILKRNVYKKKDFSPYLRPSTGMFAVLFAIDEYGFDYRYEISGISFERRDTYKVNKKVVQTDMENKINLQWHIIPDRKVVRKLLKNKELDLLIHK